MLKVFLAGAGGFCGTIFRYLIGLGLSPLSSQFPVSTLLINFTGAVIIGVLTEFSSKITAINPNLMVFLTVGICGGFTTFSTFSLETFNLLEKGRALAAFSNVFLSVALCLFGVYAGKLLIRLF